MAWVIGGYVFIGIIVMLCWAMYNEDRDNEDKSMSFVVASGFLWPAHLLWTVLRGIPQIFHIKRRPVTLTRSQQRDNLVEEAKNKVLAERNRLEAEYYDLVTRRPAIKE